MRIIYLVTLSLFLFGACSGSRQKEGGDPGTDPGTVDVDPPSDTLTDAQQKSACTDTILLEWAGMDPKAVDMDTVDFEQVKAVIESEHSSYASTELVRSPDNKMIAVTVLMEGCGAYCNPNYHNWIILPGKAQFRTEIGNIEAIHKLADNKYLLMIESWGKPAGYYSEQCYGVRIASTDGKAIWFDQVIADDKGNSGPGPNHNDEFSICQPSFVDPGEDYPYFRFDPESGSLTYGFAFQYDYQIGNGLDDTLVVGELNFDGSAFKRGKETRKPIPPMEFD